MLGRPPLTALALPILVICLVFGQGCRGSKKVPSLTPEEGLETFIMAQENADATTLIQLVVSAQRENFTALLAQMSPEDMVATGLGFRQETYQLQERHGDIATFWSTTANMYLVLALEDGMWCVDPLKTDEMNAENMPNRR